MSGESPANTNTGSCLCGAIEWETTGPVKMAINCHCSMCRKSHGSGFATFATVDAPRFRWRKGEDQALSYASSDSGERRFCRTCGSALPADAGDTVFLPVGNLAGDIEHSLDSHIFIGSKAPWLEVTDGAPQFEAYPPGFDHPPTDLGDRQPQTEGAVGGSCLCGTVRFEFDGPGDRMLNCHCERCRKARSAVHSTQVFVAADRFRWISGAENVETWALPGAKRFAPTFCKTCGSKVARVMPEANLAIIPAGCLDQDPGLRPSAHIFVGSKSPSHTITDDLPQFEEYPTDG